MRAATCGQPIDSHKRREVSDVHARSETVAQLDKSSGKLLFSGNLRGAIAGGVITYMVNGKQYVATIAGTVSRMTFQTTAVRE